MNFVKVIYLKHMVTFSTSYIMDAISVSTNYPVITTSLKVIHWQISNGSFLFFKMRLLKTNELLHKPMLFYPLQDSFFIIDLIDTVSYASDNRPNTAGHITLLR